MRIKSGVWYWLAVASGAVGMLYALGFAGSIEALVNDEKLSQEIAEILK